MSSTNLALTQNADGVSYTLLITQTGALQVSGRAEIPQPKPRNATAIPPP